MPEPVRFKRRTAAAWTTLNPTLLRGEPGFELDTNQLKIGDGVSAWNDLPYFSDDDRAAIAELADHIDNVTDAHDLVTRFAAKAETVHTHTASQITDFTEALQDGVGAVLAAGTGATVTYNDAANTITISATGTSDLEAIRDAIGVALIGVGVISVTVDDAANTITISSVATQNSTDAALRARASHTGSDPATAVSVNPSGLVVVTTANAQLALAELDAYLAARPSHEAGTLAARPAAGTRNPGSTYTATDTNNGTLYQIISGAWVKIAAGVSEAGGQVLARSENASTQVTLTDTTLTDLPGTTMNIPSTPSQSFKLRATAIFDPLHGTETAGSVGLMQLRIVDTADSSQMALTPWQFIYPGSNGLQQKVIAERALTLTAGLSKTYKAQAKYLTKAANSGNGLILADSLYSQTLEAIKD